LSSLKFNESNPRLRSRPSRAAGNAPGLDQAGQSAKSVSDYITPPGVAGDDPDEYGDPIGNTTDVANHDRQAIADSVLVPPQPGVTAELPKAGGS